MPVETYTRSVNEVFEYVKSQFGDEAGIQLGIANVLRWINVAQREIVQTNTTINEARATTNIVAGQSEYPIVGDAAFLNLQNIHTIFYNGAPLLPMPFNEAVEYIINGKENDTSGTPSIWYLKAGILHLYPEPSESVTGGLKIYFSKAPAQVTGTGDLLGVPDNYYSAVLQNVMVQAYEMDENFQAAGIKSQQFEKSVNMQANQTQSQQAEFAVIQPDYEDYN